jgi:hypothetical protein
MQGNLPRDNDDDGSDGTPQQTPLANDAQSPESGGSLEGRIIDSGERVDQVDTDDDGDDDDDWDWGEKPDSKHADGQVDLGARVDQSEGDKPPQAGGSESEITTSDASTEQPISDSEQSISDPTTSDHSDSNSNDQSEEKKTADTFDDDYFDDHYWDDVPEPEYSGNVDSGQTEEPLTLFEPPEEEEQQQQRPPVQEVSEELEEESEMVKEEHRSTVDDGDGNRGDSQGQTPQSVDESSSSDHTQSTAEAPPTEAPPTVAPSSEFPRSPDTYHSEFEAQSGTTDDKIPPSEAPPQAQSSGFEDETDTRQSETPPTGTETPPSQSDSSDHRQVEMGSRLDPSQNDIDLQSIGLQPSHPHPSPSITELPGADEEPSINTDSAKDDRDDRVPVYSSSQLPSEGEQIREPEKNTIVEGTYLPDDDDDDDIRTTPFQSPVVTQSVISTPIPGSDSTDVDSDGDIRNRDPRSLVEIAAEAERLRAQLNSDYHHQTDSNTDSFIDQGTAADRERAAADGGDGVASSTKTDHQPEARREVPLLVEDTPNQVPNRSEPEIEDGVTPPPPYDGYGSREGGASGEDTPTRRPPANADSDEFEEPPAPPRSGYSCRDDYLPMPGSNRGGWMAYHEQIRARIRDFVLDALPKEWSDWVCHNVSL